MPDIHVKRFGYGFLTFKALSTHGNQAQNGNMARRKSLLKYPRWYERLFHGFRFLSDMRAGWWRYSVCGF